LIFIGADPTAKVERLKKFRNSQENYDSDKIELIDEEVK